VERRYLVVPGIHSSAVHVLDTKPPPGERDHGPQHLSYDYFWHLGHDVLVCSEWGTPSMVTEGTGRALRASRFPHRTPRHRAFASTLDGIAYELQSIPPGSPSSSTNRRNEVLTPGRIRGQTHP